MQKIMTGITCLTFAAASLISITPAAFSVTENEPSQSVEKESPADNDPWVQLSSSQRQAYVGIHGGTAPITLLRSPDGVIYAFTGQTGNDFVQTLRSGNASHSPRTEAPDPVAAEANAPPLPTVVTNATSTVSAEDDIAQDSEAAPLADNYFVAASLIAEEESVYTNWADSPQWIASLVAGVAGAMHAPSTEEIMAAKPENYPHVVFATHEGTMTPAKTEFSPFGLATQDLPSHDALAMSPIIKDEKKVIIPVPRRVNKTLPRPLVLNDYRKIL